LAATVVKPVQTKKPVVENKQSAHGSAINKEAKKELQRQQKIFQQLEEDISKLNDKKTKLQLALASHETYSDKKKFIQAEADFKKVNDDLYQLNKQYEEVFEKIVELEGNQPA